MRRGGKTCLLHRAEDIGKRAWKSSGLHGAHRKEKGDRGSVEDYLERCADRKVDITALERVMEPEDEEVCLRYILKYLTRRGSNIFLPQQSSSSSRDEESQLVSVEDRRRRRVAFEETAGKKCQNMMQEVKLLSERQESVGGHGGRQNPVAEWSNEKVLRADL